MKSPYEVLGVAQNSPLSVCKAAYRRLAKKYHPDMPTGDAKAFDLVSKAMKAIEDGVSVVETYEPKRKVLRHKTLFTYIVA